MSIEVAICMSALMCLFNVDNPCHYINEDARNWDIVNQ